MIRDRESSLENGIRCLYGDFVLRLGVADWPTISGERSMRRLVRSMARSIGFDIVPYSAKPIGDGLPTNITEQDRTILLRIAEYTMTSIERQIALIEAVRYIVRSGIPGSFVECGVWRGGSSMAIALTLAQEGDTTRDIYLFDTFEGMTPPTDVDKSLDGVFAKNHLDEHKNGTWFRCYADLNEVRTNMASTNYPLDQLHFVKGPVEETIPTHGPPGPIALLRLDTDWYESTKHEMTHLFPLLQVGGILIIDDYGHWQGARKAIDEYLVGQDRVYFLQRIDYTARLLLKK
jgi:O-methyltransferase